MCTGKSIVLNKSFKTLQEATRFAAVLADIDISVLRVGFDPFVKKPYVSYVMPGETHPSFCYGLRDWVRQQTTRGY